MSTNDQTSSSPEPTAPLVDAPKARKFLFDCAFDIELPDDQKEPPAPTFSLDELGYAKEEARRVGIEEGRAQAREEQAARQNDLLNDIAGKLGALSGESVAVWQDQLEQMQTIALVIARKIMPHMIAAHGTEEIEAILSAALAELGHEPRLVVRLSEDDFSAVSELIDSLTARAAFPGKIVLLADASMTRSECRVEWADGGMERDLKSLWSAIDKIIEAPPEIQALLTDKLLSEDAVQLEDTELENAQPQDAQTDNTEPEAAPLEPILTEDLHSSQGDPA